MLTLPLLLPSALTVTPLKISNSVTIFVIVKLTMIIMMMQFAPSVLSCFVIVVKLIPPVVTKSVENVCPILLEVMVLIVSVLMGTILHSYTLSVSSVMLPVIPVLLPVLVTPVKLAIAPELLPPKAVSA